MPILGRKPETCFEEFRKHIAALLSCTLSPTFVLGYDGRGSRRVLGYLRGKLTTIPLVTRLGTLHFYLAQRLEAEEEGRVFRLRTVNYWYRLQTKPGLNEPALLRWEYDSEFSPEAANPCRHHVQLNTRLTVDADFLDLNRTHLPTGWVTIEEIIRFLIVELGVAPPCTIEWPARLVASERAFYEKFTPKKYP